ncbi:MAG: MBL fold metallo-hydrolase [Pyrinomonadaceae bacterium]
MVIGGLAASATLVRANVFDANYSSAPESFSAFADFEPQNKVTIEALKLSDNIHMITGAGGNIGVLTGGDGVLIIDSGYANTSEATKAKITTLSTAPLHLLVNTHWHGDHTEGNETMHKAGATIIAHENVYRRMKNGQEIKFFKRTVPPAPKAALPVQTFNESLTLRTNDEELHLLYIPPAHTDGDVIIHFRNANILHTGDLLFNGLYPFIDVSSGGSIDGMVKAADKILSVVDDKTKVIPGHGKLATRADLNAFRDMLATISERIKKLIAQGKSIDEIVAAQPSKDFDATWGNGFLKPEQFVRLSYGTIVKE